MSGAAPANALFIGDDRRNDADAARAAGLRGFWLGRSGGDGADPARLAMLADFLALLVTASRKPRSMESRFLRLFANADLRFLTRTGI